MDDILITGNNSSEITSLKEFLNIEFRIKDLGLLHYFLGLEILREPEGIIISQRKYTCDLLNEFDVSPLSNVSSPLDPSSKLTTDSGPLLADLTIYRHLIGKLNYLTHTRPDLCFAVLTLSQYMQRPCLGHFAAALRIVKYLQKHPGQWIFMAATPFFSLFAFCDVDWATCKDTRRSVSGFFISMGGSPISWKSK